jgi:hypothetical protein
VLRISLRYEGRIQAIGKEYGTNTEITYFLVPNCPKGIPICPGMGHIGTLCKPFLKIKLLKSVNGQENCFVL